LRDPRPHSRFEWGASGTSWRESGTRRTPLATNPSAPLVTATRAVIGGFIRALVAGAPVPSPGTDGLAALQVIAAAYRSAELGRAVRLDGPDAAETAALRLTGAVAA